MLIEWITTIILLILSIILNLWLIWQKVKTNDNFIKIGNDFSELRQILMEERNKYSRLNGQYQQLNIYYDHLKDEKNKIADELYHLQLDIQENEHKKLLITEMDAQLNDLRTIIENKKVELDNLSLSGAAILADQDEKLRKSKELETSIEALERRIVEYCEREAKLKDTITDIEGELSNLVLLKTSVLQIEEGAGNRWELNVVDAGKIRFLELIETLISEYGAAVPELRTGLAKIAWSSVWLPMVQELCGREGLDGRGGIYKLTSKADERVCYIGQATNIKDRWYTHIKKMVGVEAKGLERLYTYRPDELYWEVVEFKDGDLDSDEHYWIEYYKSKEIGLNKKR